MDAKLIARSSNDNAVSIEGYPRKVSAVVALRRLYELLEDYAPMWYSEEAHDLAAAALGEISAGSSGEAGRREGICGYGPQIPSRLLLVCKRQWNGPEGARMARPSRHRPALSVCRARS